MGSVYHIIKEQRKSGTSVCTGRADIPHLCFEFSEYSGQKPLCGMSGRAEAAAIMNGVFGRELSSQLNQRILSTKCLRRWTVRHYKA
jgi:hypothetical protein